MSNRVTAQKIWLGFVERTGLPIADEARHVAGQLLPEMNEYLELVLAQGGASIGLMTRGEVETFTARAAALMRRWGMPEAGVDEFVVLARRFEHKRSFVKLEWSAGPGGRVERLAAFYFRRRPPVTDVLRHLLARGVDPAILEEVMELAALLDKDTVHFVAGAMRPGSVVHHKLYFSQYAAPDVRTARTEALGQVLVRFGVDAPVRELVLAQHEALLPPQGDETFFVSVRFDDRALAPGVKLDYHLAAPAVAAAFVPPEQQESVAQEARMLCDAVSVPALSYLGVTLAPASPPRLKYYADRASLAPIFR